MIRTLFLGAMASLVLITTSQSAGADPFSNTITMLHQESIAQLQINQQNFNDLCGGISVSHTQLPVNGRLAVETSLCGPQTPIADLIATYDLNSQKITWAWAQHLDKEWSTAIAEDYRDRADEPGFSEFGRPGLRLAGREVAYSVSSIGVLMSDAQLLFTFEDETKVSYVLLTFDEVPS